jgi:dCTP deaminase
MLSNKQIWWFMQQGDIVINPFDEKQLGTNSYDVRLGNYYYLPNPEPAVDFGGSVDFTQEYFAKFFWLGPRFSVDDIVVPPGETILAHTQETIGGRNRITTSMRARSSIGRSCLSVCKCAGVGDVGFINRWTMEISNHSKVPIAIPVGLRIAQIEFHDVGKTYKEYSGKYAHQDREWQPEDMLPRLYLDTDYLEYQRFVPVYPPNNNNLISPMAQK